MATDDEVLTAYVVGKDVYVWDASTAMRLRREFRIVGSFTGTLPKHTAQNTVLGLPMKLMSPEVQLGLEKGFLRLVDGSLTGLGEPGQDARDAYKAYLDERASKERADRQARRDNGGAKGRGKGEGKGKVVGAAARRRAREEQRRRDLHPYACINREESGARKQDAIEPSTWTYPETDKEKLDYRVFRHLWEQGNYVTSGNNFGGDFLVYVGDPLMVHAAYTVICRDRDAQFSAQDVVAFGRLGCSVRKSPVVMSVAEDGQVDVITVAWEGR